MGCGWGWIEWKEQLKFFSHLIRDVVMSPLP